MSLPQKLDLPKMQTQWAQQLNPIVANPLVNGQILKNVSLVTGTNVVNHGLQRNLQGWYLISPKGPQTVYQAAQQPNPTLSLTLISSGAMVTDIGVF